LPRAAVDGGLRIAEIVRRALGLSHDGSHGRYRSCNARALGAAMFARQLVDGLNQKRRYGHTLLKRGRTSLL
jgi:hypothetical protein